MVEAEAIESNWVRVKGTLYMQALSCSTKEPWNGYKHKVTNLHLGWVSSALRWFEQALKGIQRPGGHSGSCCNIQKSAENLNFDGSGKDSSPGSHLVMLY